MRIEIEVSHSEIENTIDKYEALGFTNTAKKVKDRDTVILEFVGRTLEIPDTNAVTYLDFSDGTSSKLFIRRNHNFSDD